MELAAQSSVSALTRPYKEQAGTLSAAQANVNTHAAPCIKYICCFSNTVTRTHCQVIAVKASKLHKLIYI